MRKAASILVLAGLLAGAAPAAAKPISYVGKTSGGHEITFKLRGGKIYNPVAGVPTTCLPIQGGGTPQTGVDLMHPAGWVKVGDTIDFWTQEKPFAYYNEVRINQRFSSQRRARGVITGKLRMQYQFLIPKYPPGTFSIYSCLGNATFKARPKR
jgi:hypothetical protein